jgi:hypothetical protein
MIKNILLPKFVASFFVIALFALASQSASAATIVIQNNDQPNVGFNDPTPVSPVGNNTGTTLGQQRLNAFQFAANIWGATLNSSVTITIQASWASLGCTATSGTLGAAGTNSLFANFTNAPQANTWYPGALANALAGRDLNTNSAEIKAQFNTDLGQSTCLGGTPFYLGLDNNFGTGIDLVSVLLHEFAHGLGFESFYNPNDGSEPQPQNFPGIFDFFLQDNSTGKKWNEMTNAERLTSSTNTGNLVWIGSRTVSEARNVLGTARVIVNAPSAATINASGEAYSPDIRARQLALNAGATTRQVAGSVATTSPADACSAVSSAVSGKIALIDRGTCNFSVKVKNAQIAGAMGAVIANIGSSTNMPIMGGADSTVAIPAVLISFNDGNTLKGQLSSGLNVSLVTDASALTGADAQGHPRMYAPNPVDQGSSVSHWDDLEFPDLLMEWANTNDTIHSVAVPADLTLAQLRDIGWQGNPIGDNAFFVRQQYLDFLNRQPDSSGYSFWVNDVFNCGIDQGCAEVHRINVSAAFFLSIEFQDTGNLVYKMWKAGFGNSPGTPVAVRRANFLQDSQTIQNSPNQIIVGQGNWQANLEANKQAFALSFVQRAGFPSQTDAAGFVGTLFANAGVTPTANEQNAAIAAFGSGGNAGRAAALRSVCDSASVSNALRNEAFVLMQYFGYLQRDPDAQTPADYSGYNFWLGKLNQFNGNYIQAEMVKAFLSSTEYRARFGNP